MSNINKARFSTYKSLNLFKEKVDDFKFIHEWLKDSTGEIEGCVVATKHKNDNHFNIDYSLCHPGDVFNKNIGLIIAVNRSLLARKKRIKSINKLISDSDPSGLSERIKFMITRAERYFKNTIFRKN